jgi:hypothetical protein
VFHAVYPIERALPVIVLADSFSVIVKMPDCQGFFDEQDSNFVEFSGAKDQIPILMFAKPLAKRYPE